MEGFRPKGAHAAASRKLTDLWMEYINIHNEEEITQTEVEITNSILERLRTLTSELDSTQWMFRKEFY